MTITPGEDTVAEDFIDEAERDATPSNDEGRVAKLQDDAKVHPIFTKNGFEADAGEIINGGTTPVPVYQNKTDNEVYQCDADDNTKYKFIGFAISDGTDGNNIYVQTNGVVGGFSGFSEGEKYYVQDTAGTIGTTAGTHAILVGIAISETELLIQKGKHRAHGTFLADNDASEVVTLGFRPEIIRVHTISSASDRAQHSSHGTWINGAYATVYSDHDLTDESEGETTGSYIGFYRNSANREQQITITSVTDTGFTFSTNETDTMDGLRVAWEAEGEL